MIGGSIMRNRLGLAATITSTVAIFSVPASAATTTTTFLVNATVTNTCIAAAAPLAFGAYNTTSSTATNGTATVTVTCTTGSAYNVGLDAGTATGATVTARKLTGAVNTTSHITYDLFRDSGRTLNWGNTVGTDTVSQTATVTPAILTVYGLIPASQNVVTDTYADTITVTVTY
jgi:spore coat protein U-like protein